MPDTFGLCGQGGRANNLLRRGREPGAAPAAANDAVQ